VTQTCGNVWGPFTISYTVVGSSAPLSGVKCSTCIVLDVLGYGCGVAQVPSAEDVEAVVMDEEAVGTADAPGERRSCGARGRCSAG